MHFKTNSRYDLGGSGGGKWKQVGSKKRCKILSENIHLLGSTFRRILDDFRKKNGCMLEQNSFQNQCQLRNAIYWKNIVFPKEKQWFWMFGGSGVGNKNERKIYQKWAQDGKASWHQILMDFGGFLDGNWEGKWSQVGTWMASKIDANIEKCFFLKCSCFS